MPFVVADRVKETSTTTGTGSYALAGAVSNFRAFSSVCANTDTVNYAAVDNSGAGWEVGLGTWSTGNTLARTTIYASSNGGAAVNWSTGTREIFLTAAATFLASRAASGANSDITSLTGLTTALSVGQGGTGTTALTANNVILGNGTSAVQFVAPGTSGNVLTSDGTTWVSQAGGGGGGLLGDTDSATPFETSLGFEAGNSTTGVNNTFVGYQAGKANTSGTNNTALGYQAFDVATTGSNNVAVGSAALGALTTGASNVAIGAGALDAATTGGINVAIGLNAMGSGVATAAEGNNVAIGEEAGREITSGTRNVGIGIRALANATTGGYNIAIGDQAMGSQTVTAPTGYNTAIGVEALRNITGGSHNTGIGFTAGRAISTGTNNVAIGQAAGVALTTGSNNVAIGTGALDAATTGGRNIAIGQDAMGSGIATNTTGDNICIGFRAGNLITSAVDNVFIGGDAGNTVTTGNNNVVIGRGAVASSATTSNEITLGDGNITNFRVPGVGFRFNTTNGMVVPKTVTAAGTTGAQTINRTAGTVNFAAAATSLVVTNSFVDANSIIIATVGTNDSTMKSVAAVAGAGSFTLHANAAATAETRVNFLVVN